MPAIIHVAIPAYNKAAYIREAIESVIVQTYPHWVLHVHDNCSQDETCAIVESFNDRRITLIKHSKHVPMWQSWNRCIEALHGDFLQIVCADDKLHPECFSEKMKYAAMPEHADVTLFSSNRMLISKQGRQMFAIGFSQQQQALDLNQVMGKAYKVINPIGDPGTGMARVSAISAPPFTDRYPCFVDLELWLHVLEKGRLLHIPKALSYFRVTGTSMTTTRFAGNSADTFRFYRERVRPFYKRKLFKYGLGYINMVCRIVMREFLYLLNK